MHSPSFPQIVLTLFYIDERFEKKYKQAVEDLSAITAEWNVTDLPGYDCYVDRELGIPVSYIMKKILTVNVLRFNFILPFP